MREGSPSGPVPDATKAPRSRTGGPLRALGWGLVFLGTGLAGVQTTLPDMPLTLIAPSSGILVIWFSLSTRTSVGWDLAALTGAGCLLAAQLGLPAQLVAVAPLVLLAQLATFVAVMRRVVPDLAPYGGQRLAWQLRDLGALLVAAAASAMVSAVLSTVSQGASGLPTGDLATFLVRWGRSTSTIVAVGTVGLMVAPGVARAWRARRTAELVATAREELTGSRRHTAEAVALLAVSVGFTGGYFLYLDHLPLTFLLFVLTGWAGLRFSPVTAAVQGLLVGAIAVGATLTGHGIFAATIGAPAHRAAVAQVFVLVMSTSGVALALIRRQLTVAEQLAEARARMLDQVLGAVHDGIMVFAEDGSVPMSNRASRLLVDTGGTGGTTVVDGSLAPGRPLELFDSAGERVAADRAPHRRALAGETVSDEDHELRFDDGSPNRWVRVTADRLPEDPGRPGEPARALVSFHDVTDDRRHVDALATFAANVAHDLRGPLSVVEAWNEVLSDAFEDGDVSASYALPITTRIAAASVRMRDFIQALLDYTLARDRTLLLAEVDLVAVARDVAELRTQTGHAEPPVVRVAGRGVAMADPVLIRIVVDNLVANAIKYVAPGVRPQILVDVVDPGRGTVQVRVVDNGIGIPVDQRSQVFESFHRVELHGTIEGSGLGLGICHRIVERHGGTICVEDVTDGTSLRISLPAATAVAPGLGADVPHVRTDEVPVAGS